MGWGDEGIGIPFLTSFVFVQFKANLTESSFNLTFIKRQHKIQKYAGPFFDISIFCRLQSKVGRKF